MNTLIIAEIGVNHNGDLDLAKSLIRSAKESGADAVKFQTFTAESLVSAETPKVKYQKKTTLSDESHFEMIKSLELSKDYHYELFKYCSKVDIEFMSTPYDEESVFFLDDLGVQRFKTASADIVDLMLHKAISCTKKDVIISTGMATYEEIDSAIGIYSDQTKISLLHCVSNYPCSLESINLNVMKSLKDRYNLEVGYSDHAESFAPSVASIALGGTIIERHFTLNKDLPGPDHRASSTPEEFKHLVSLIRSAEISLGTYIKEVQAEEVEMRNISRKSLFYSKNIKKNETLSEQHVCLKRPGTGLYAYNLKEIIGKKASDNFEKGMMIKKEDFSD